MFSLILLAALLPCSSSTVGSQQRPGGESGAESPFSTELVVSNPYPVAQGEDSPEIKNPKAAAAARRACDWLAAQQNKDGSWSPMGTGEAATASEKTTGDGLDDDEFWKRALDGQPTDEVPKKQGQLGDPLHSIGVTGLAVLALIEGGSSMTKGRHEGTILKAVKFLVSAQDSETGLIGKPLGHAFHYDHAIATLALARLQGTDHPPALLKKVQAAANYIARARNPYSAWRYDYPPNGDNDSSVTTWMILAVAEAGNAGVKIDSESFPAVIEWFNEMTEEGTGRIGYTERGSASSRVPRMNVDFETAPETLTAAGLVSRLACGQSPRQDTVIVSHVRCILQALPGEDDAKITDTLWLYFGTQAMRQIGSRPWANWSKAMIPLALAAQKTKGPAAGAFDPQAVAWGFSTGRVGTTALTAAALHVASR